ncbi:hypothetical protein BGZ94_000229 [Podila epigama]|nr:hypothetical protein BGZ94_000229 [Podila epigama]
MTAPAFVHSPVVIQTIEENGKLLASLPTFVNETTSERYILWSGVRLFCEQLHRLRYCNGDQVIYVVDNDYKVILPPRIKYSHRPLVIVSDTKPGAKYLVPKDPLHHVKRDLHNYETFVSSGCLRITESRDRFLKAMATVEYLREMLLDRIAQDCDDGVIGDTRDSQDQRTILVDTIRKIDIQLGQNDLSNRCQLLLQSDSDRWECPLPRLFLVLPWNFDHWDAADTSTHQFRLFFLCEPVHRHNPKDPHNSHIHLSHHSGYDIHKPLEFLHRYGAYALTILEMVKHGHSHKTLQVSKLQTFEILSHYGTRGGNNSNNSGNGTDGQQGHTPLLPARDHAVSESNLRPLVDSAIAYIENLLQAGKGYDSHCNRRCNTQTRLNKTELWQMKTYLLSSTTLKKHQHDLHHHGVGDLLLSARGFAHCKWMCRHHWQEANRDLGAMEQLGIEDCNGANEFKFDKRSGTLSLRIDSVARARQWAVALKKTGYQMELFVRVDDPVASATADVYEMVSLLTGPGVGYVLRIDGNTPSMNKMMATWNIFESCCKDGHYSPVVVHGCPSRIETSIYLKGYEGPNYRLLVQGDQVEATAVDWDDLRDDFFKAVVPLLDRGYHSDTIVGASRDHAMQQLTVALAKHSPLEMSAVDVYDSDNYGWIGRLVARDGVVHSGDIQGFLV